MKIETKNAKIESTFLGIEDHGHFTCMLHLRFDGSGQGFGGYDLAYKAYGIRFLRKILEVVGVDSWEKLPGRYVRMTADRGKVHGIGHIVENRWFYPEADFLEPATTSAEDGFG